MLNVRGTVHLSASDLVGHLNCRYLTSLDLAVANGVLAKPFIWDVPILEVLAERGALHEQGYVMHPHVGRNAALRPLIAFHSKQLLPGNDAAPLAIAFAHPPSCRPQYTTLDDVAAHLAVNYSTSALNTASAGSL